TLFLHTRTAYQDDRALKLSASDEPQIFAVRVNGSEDYIQIDNLSTGESHKVHGVSWGDGGNVMKFFYNDGGEYWMGDFYWMYYSFEYLTDEQLQDLYYYRSDIAETTYIPGDVNNDGVVAVNDVVLAINAVLGQTPEGFVHEAADMSGDGQIMVNDVVLMINVILGVDSSPAKARKFLEDNFRYLLKE
ncbi:MAG: dockerin type I repeat-containing protein, partial [Bacteroidaceae bacterium]|nr:dockerin type I repeat-containing protein [Bacteroidaceae bacterium]